jgi:hypothetical protein
VPKSNDPSLFLSHFVTLVELPRTQRPSSSFDRQADTPILNGPAIPNIGSPMDEMRARYNGNYAMPTRAWGVDRASGLAKIGAEVKASF